jgi:regulator of chromosome condensation
VQGNDGIIGFTENSRVQQTPMRIPELKRITKIASGSNHVLALDNKGNVFAWGAGQQNQLGRRVVERTRSGGLVPREFGLPRGKIIDISCGAYHSFAIDNKGKVWTWGLNNFGETGIFEGAGEDNAVIFKPTVVTALEDYNIKEIRGGAHHSLACTQEGQLLVWGRADGSQVGIPIEELPKEDLVYDERGKARILAKPTVLTSKFEFSSYLSPFADYFSVPSKSIRSVAAGSDNSFAIDTTGKAYSWGFSANYQTGQGTDDDIFVPTLIDNNAVRDKKLTGAAAGGQFSILYGEHQVQVNGSA